MKKIVILLICIIGIIGIYYKFDNRKKNYVSLTDGIINYNNYLIDVSFINDSIINMTKDIKNNRTIKMDREYYLKKSLRESDYVIVSIGMKEIIDKYDKLNMNNNLSLFNKMYLDIENLIVELKKYSNNIIFIGYYNPTDYYDSKVDQLFFNFNNKLNRLMTYYDISYLDIYELFKGDNSKNSIYKKLTSMLKF